MMYPKKITPNPLVSSTIEIRFKTESEYSSIFKLLFGRLSDKFPEFENSQLPKDIREKNPELKYYPDYIFSNTDYSISFNENFISYENITEYKLWDEYSSFYKEVLELILDSGVMNNIERIGVRYQSRFDVDNFTSVIKESPSMKIDGLAEDFVSYTSKIKNEEFDIFLRLKKDIRESSFDSKENEGHLIDIDVFISNNVEKNEIFNRIDSAHLILKKLFFGLLKDNFIQTLNPEY